MGVPGVREVVRAANLRKALNASRARPCITVYLSAHQFHDRGLVSIVEGAYTPVGSYPSAPSSKLTGARRCLMAQTLAVIEALNRLGGGNALDDSGTGFSTFTYLVLLNAKFIKIDQTFVRPPRGSTHNDLLLEAISSLGNCLAMALIAEGIETHGQHERFRCPRCEFGQGVLCSATVPAAHMATTISHVLGNGSEEVSSSIPGRNLLWGLEINRSHCAVDIASSSPFDSHITAYVAFFSPRCTSFRADFTVYTVIFNW